MRPKRTPERRKCIICWSWYRPHAAAAKTQRVCFHSECRRVHRNRQVRARRREDQARFRIADRRRQRRWRKANLAESASLSRATLPPEALEMIEENVAKLAEEQTMSRARLRRQLIRTAQISLERMAQATPVPSS